MRALSGALIGVCLAFVILLFGKRLGLGTTLSALGAPPWEKRGATTLKARSVGLKMALGALAGMICVVFGESRKRPQGVARVGWTPTQRIEAFLFTAVLGALVGFCLALRDLVLARQSQGLRVHPVLRVFFGWGLVSVILWIIIAVVLGIGGVFIYLSVLMAGVEPAH